MRIELGTCVALIGAALVVAYTLAGYWNDMFWPRQVIARWGRPGIALAIHGAVLSDLFILTTWASVMINYLAPDWDPESIGYATLWGLGITLANQMVLMYTQNTPDPMGWKEEWWSATIFFHFIYMWGAVTILALVLLYSPSATTTMILVTCIFIGVHMFFGMHFPFGMMNRFTRWTWCPEFLTGQAFIMQAVVWTLLAIFGGYSSGLWVGVVTFSVGAVLIFGAAVVAAATAPIETAS